jgi:hypothetical protein
MNAAISTGATYQVTILLARGTAKAANSFPESN